MLKNIKKYFRGVQSEAKKIAWPSKKEVQNHTVIVIVTVAVVMTVYGLFDLGFTKLLELALQ